MKSTPFTASRDFNAPARPIAAEAITALGNITDNIRKSENTLCIEDLNAMGDLAKEFLQIVREQKAVHLLDDVRNRMGALKHSEAPFIGRQFASQMARHGFVFTVDDTLMCSASYTSYSYAPENRGFLNEVRVNSQRVDEAGFILSVGHELFHGFQKHAAPALRHSPFNPDTRIVIHPADWILLETLCERDAFTKEAFFAKLLAEKSPEIKNHYSLIPVEDIETALKAAPTLSEAIMAVALESQHRPHDRAHPRGKNYLEHWQGIALRNFSAGMWNRHDQKEENIVYVRLEAEDFWQVGNYGVGPNSFGDSVRAELIAPQPFHTAALQAAYDQMCMDYNIPPLEKCVTLNALREHTTQPAMQFN